MKDLYECLQEIKNDVDKILKSINIADNIIVKCKYNSKYSRSIASAMRIYDDLFILQIGDLFFSLSDKIKFRVLQHEIAHMYDELYNRKNSIHDKKFKDLCGFLYGDRKIGQATIKGWDD